MNVETAGATRPFSIEGRGVGIAVPGSSIEVAAYVAPCTSHVARTSGQRRDDRDLVAHAVLLTRSA